MKLLPSESNSIDGKSTLVQVIACCRQAIGYYPGQCWLRSTSPYLVNSAPMSYTDPVWLSLTNELKFFDWQQQINER